MIRLSGQLLCGSAEEAAIVARHLPDHIRLTRAEPGCLSFDVVQTADPLVWQVDETFTDQAAFAVHQARTGTSDWARTTADIPRRYNMITD